MVTQVHSPFPSSGSGGPKHLHFHFFVSLFGVIMGLLGSVLRLIPWPFVALVTAGVSASGHGACIS